jgi:hypothetical protein
MRILHINSYYQTGAFYKNLFDRQAAMGDEIAVYTPVPKGFDPAGRDCGPYARLDANHRRMDRLIFPLKQKKMLRGALNAYAGRRFDVIHAHSLLTNGGVALALSRRMGVPFVAAVRDTDVNVLLRRMPAAAAGAEDPRGGVPGGLFVGELPGAGAVALPLRRRNGGGAGKVRGAAQRRGRAVA